jgi:uncharacterized membrane protein HdeD (DUF308 family)
VDDETVKAPREGGGSDGPNAPDRHADVLAGVGRHWGWALAFGILTLGAGLLALAWPGRTVVVVAVLVGIQLVAAGIFRLLAALASDDETGGTRALLALLGVLSFIVGLYALRHLAVTVATLAVALGVWLLVLGVLEVVLAFRLRSAGQAAARIAPATP